MSIASGVSFHRKLIERNNGKMLPTISPEPITVPIGPDGAPPLDLPAGGGAPNRGQFPASLVQVSDRSDNSREFRGSNMRSSTFPYAPAATNTGSNLVASLQEKSAAQQSEILTASTKAAQAAASAADATSNVADLEQTTVVALVGSTLQQVPLQVLQYNPATPNLDNLNDGTSYQRVLSTALTSGAVDSTKAGFLSTYGSIPSTIVGSTASIFSYTSTSTTANISWSSFQLFFSNGSTATIASGSQSVTGLTSGTYYYYPYVASGATTVSFVTGGSGTPGVLFNPQSATAAQAQNAQNVTALSVGSVTIIVTTGGSGVGGGSGRCCSSATIVQNRDRGNVSLGSCKVGDCIMGRDGWVQIEQFQLVPHKHFVRLTTQHDGAVEITATHRITVIRGEGEQSVPATEVNLRDFLITKTGYAILRSIESVEVPIGQKVVLTVSEPHTFFAGDDSPSILVSNAVPIS